MTDYFDFWRLLAGLGVFLFGMQQLEVSLKLLAGKGFRRFLRRTTQKPLLSVFSGMIATVIVQSSSLVGLIVLALVGAGIIPLLNAVGVVLGTNLGTTFTGWIVATIGFKLNLEAVTLPILGIGGLGLVIFKGRLNAFSQLLFGLSMLLMGLAFMKESVATLSDFVDIQVLSGYPLIIFLVVGAIFTVIIQSSSAAMMITLSALSAGIIPLPAAVALVIGADLGTTSTVFIGSLQGAIAKRRVAMAHILFNLTVDTIAFIALFPLLELIDWLSLTDPLYSLVAFHSLFNLFGIILFTPFISPFTKFLESWIRDDQQSTCHYILNVPSNITDVALEALEKECLYLIHLVACLNLRFLSIDLSDPSINQLKHKHHQSLAKMLAMNKLANYEAIKNLEGEIVNYSLEIQTQPIDKETAGTIDLLLDSVRHAVFSAKSLKDIHDNLVSFIDHDNAVITQKFHDQQQLIQAFYQKIFSLFDRRHESEFFTEEIEGLHVLIDNLYRSHASGLYSDAAHTKFNNLDLSTLLNVNKEIHTSCEAFYKAVNRFWIKTAVRDF